MIKSQFLQMNNQNKSMQPFTIIIFLLVPCPSRELFEGVKGDLSPLNIQKSLYQDKESYNKPQKKRKRKNPDQNE